MRSFIATWFAVLLLLPGFASAQDTMSAAIFNLEAPTSDKVLADTLTSVVRNEARQSGRYEAVNKFPIRLPDVALLVGCSADSPSCLKGIAREVNARVLIYGSLRRPNADSTQLEVNIFDVDKSEMLGRLTRTLPNTDDPVVGFRKEIEQFFAREKPVAAVTRLQVGSNADGAQVRIDQKFVGVVPLERKDLAPGKYAVQVAHPNFQVWETQVTLNEGESLEVWAQMTPLKVAPEVVKTELKDRPIPDSPRGTNWAAWSAISVGGLSLAGAVVTGVLVESTESAIESEATDGMLTEARYSQLFSRGEDLELAHRILLGVGIAGVAIGGVMLAIDGLNESKASVGIGPAGVTARVTW